MLIGGSIARTWSTSAGGSGLVAELVQSHDAHKRWHGGGEPEHEGCQAFSFDVEVPQLGQPTKLLQAVLGVVPAEQ